MINEIIEKTASIRHEHPSDYKDKDGYLVTAFGGETKKTYSIGYGATLLADYIREMSVNGTSFTKITSNDFKV